MTTVDIREQIKRLRRLARNPSGKTMKRWGAEYGTFEPLRNMLNEDADTMEKLLAVYEAAKKYIESESRTAAEYADKYALYLRLLEALTGAQTKQEPCPNLGTDGHNHPANPCPTCGGTSTVEPKQDQEMPYTVACRCGKLWINLDADERYCRSCGFDLIGDPVESGQDYG